MVIEGVLSKYFDTVYLEVNFIKKTYAVLKQLGFTEENSIAAVCVCRDEISQSIRSLIKYVWGEAFNLSSLAAMFTAGKTGLSAAIHHAPRVDGRQRYVFYAIPHIAIDGEGRLGFCKRRGIKEDSIACGALHLFLSELKGGTLQTAIDAEDIEQSILRRRLLSKIPYGHMPDLLELTKIMRTIIQADIERAIETVVDTTKSDFAMLTGIQIHAPEGNYIWPSESYAVISGIKQDLKWDQ